MITNILLGDLKSKLIVGGVVAAGLYFLLKNNNGEKPKNTGLNGTGKKKKSISKGRKTASFKI